MSALHSSDDASSVKDVGLINQAQTDLVAVEDDSLGPLPGRRRWTPARFFSSL